MSRGLGDVYKRQGFSFINSLIMDLISDLSASEKSANAVGADEIKQKKKMIWAVSRKMKRGIKYIVLNANYSGILFV